MPRYNPGSRLDPSQVQDVRGRRMGGPVAIGGGTIGIIIFVVTILMGGNPLDQLGTGAPALDETQGGSDLSTACQTGADAEQREDCRIVLFVNSVQEHWTRDFAARGQRYQPARTQLFTQATQTACGNATSQVGPFYCPLDNMVYLDLGFFRELMDRLGAQGGEFAQAYVIAHEYGHHVQNLIGTLDAAQRDRSGAESGAVRVELQADCLAGAWAKNAVATGFFTALTEADIADALDAAAAVGDDRIQKTTTGRVNPEKFTHGSSAQRQAWFSRGYREGSIRACDTFAGGI